jgi:hypothetical protein
LVVSTADGVSLPANRVVSISVREPVQAAAPVAIPAPAMVEVEETEKFKNFAFDVGPYYGYDFDRNNNLIGGNLSMDYRMNEYLSIGLEQAVFWIADDNGLGARSVGSLDLSVGPIADLGSFGKAIPYVGANAGMIYGDKMDDDFIYGPELGIDFGFATAKIAYDMRDSGVDKGVISVTVGGLLRF